MVTHTGGCHCGRIRFDVQAPADLEVSDCSGIKSFYVPRSHPDGFSVNARCLDEGTVRSMNITPFNGREWEKQYPKGRAE